MIFASLVVGTDDLVLAMFSNDKKWYRGRVLKVTETSSLPDVEVLYIDYGNVETISLTKYACHSICSLSVLHSFNGKHSHKNQHVVLLL